MAELIEKAKFARPVDRAEVARSWAARGYSCQPFTDPPGREWNGFVHATNELVTILEGRLELAIGDEVVVAEAGDEVFIPKRAVHSVKNVHSGTTRWLFGYD
ncbi:MAG: cupin domain-containing protein [Alphaproteobacteria bacterium]|jgi:quercetin dioxygenase-like cupin family protein|nr:cupin domain-containing protein [Alphaproteobacteria bacterium]